MIQKSSNNDDIFTIPIRNQSPNNPLINIGISLSNWHNEFGFYSKDFVPFGITRNQYICNIIDNQKNKDFLSYSILKEVSEYNDIKDVNLNNDIQFQSLEDFISSHNSEIQITLNNNLSIARRLQFTINMKNYGLFYLLSYLFIIIFVDFIYQD